MVPVAGPPAAFKVFPIPSFDVLARCLDVSIEELDWFADLRHMNAARAPSAALAHYHHRWSPSRAAAGACWKSPSRA